MQLRRKKRYRYIDITKKQTKLNNKTEYNRSSVLFKNVLGI
jgi:hypothetical protein